MNRKNVELILPKLKCVKCGSKNLRFDKEKARIICLECGESYEVIEGIPIMIPSEEVRNDYNVKIFDENSDRYDGWFDREKGKLLYRMELDALKMALRGVSFSEGIEIGVGSGRFAYRVGVRYGLDPSLELLKLASRRGILSVLGIAEDIPFVSSSFDFSLIMFSICFLEDSEKAIAEISRILKPNGFFAIGFIPRGSRWGDFYLEKGRRGGIFYRRIKLHTEEEIKEIASNYNLALIKRVGALTQPPSEEVQYEKPSEGEGDFSFVVHLYKRIP